MTRPLYPKVSFIQCLGAALLIVGTTIGGGMLALPVVTSQTGFVHSTLSLIVIWFLMTVGAWIILETNIKYPIGTHFTTTAKKALGPAGMWISLFLFILLMFSLLSAYLSAGGDLIQGLANFEHIHISIRVALILFAVVFSSIVMIGIRSVDLINRLIMALKVMTFLALIGITSQFIHVHLLITPGIMPSVKVTMAMITAFGFSIILPSIRRLVPNISQFRKVLFWGSFTPLVCYIAWECVIFGVIPQAGHFGLIHLSSMSNPIQHLMMSIAYLTQNEAAKVASRIFTSVCVMTAFLGVALSLSDCIRDALNDGRPKHKHFNNKIVYALSFLPPLIIVLFFPAIFVFCIGFAGIICVLLLMVLPAAIGLRTFQSFKLKMGLWLYLLITIGFIVVAFMAY